MKKQLLSILLVFTAALAIAQNTNCTKVKQLVSEANKKQLQKEVTSETFQTADDFQAWIAATKLEGATKCYVQDAQVSKMYVAEFGSSTQSKAGDPELLNKMETIAKMLNGCLGTGFAMREVKGGDFIFKGFQYDGKGENANTTITLLLVYNPGEKKQMLFLSIVND
jgi:collagenase-like PrtC family protease